LEHDLSVPGLIIKLPVQWLFPHFLFFAREIVQPESEILMISNRSIVAPEKPTRRDLFKGINNLMENSHLRNVKILTCGMYCQELFSATCIRRINYVVRQSLPEKVERLNSVVKNRSWPLFCIKSFMSDPLKNITTRIVICFFTVLLMHLIKPDCEAAVAQLEEVTNTGQAGMLRISFHLDQVPEFDLDVSGQRVRMIFQQTRFSPSFKNLPRGSMIEPLIQITTRQNEHDSIVDMFFRNIPSTVDVTVDDRLFRLNVNIFWRSDARGARPGIMDESIGRFRPIESGAYARRVISSEYAGRWIEFFKKFEWPADIQLPVTFSLPRYPGPFARDNIDYFPEDIFNFSIRKMCVLLSPAIGQDISESPLYTQGIPSDLAMLMKAKCMLHNRQFEEALGLLDMVPPPSSQLVDAQAVTAWRDYFYAFATAASGRHHKAADLLQRSYEKSSGTGTLAPWYRLLQAEIDLAVQNPRQAMFKLEQQQVDPDTELGRILSLRMADALYAMNRYDDALAYYTKHSHDLRLMQKYPESIAALADVLYRQGRFEEAYRYYFLLSDAIAESFPGQGALADYWSAMALYRADEESRAILMLWDIEDNAKETDAAARSQLKLLDLEILGRAAPAYGELIKAYGKIAKTGPSRQVREEAFFKHLLAYHLDDRDVDTVKFLGRFFNDFWAGDLQPEAQALLVELMPGVINEMVGQEAFFEALSLVARHRELLAQADITYGFLYHLAESYVNAGFLDQAVRTYLYIMDFEKKKEKHEKVFLPLIRIYSQQENYPRVLEYASVYLEDYERGEDRVDIYYYYAEALYKTGNFEHGALVLTESDRPACSRLDALAGQFFYENNDLGLAADYFSRAVATKESRDLIDVPQINLRRAEISFENKNLGDALVIYESLMSDTRFQGQAGYRRVQICLKRGEARQALNIYRELVEMEVEAYWLDLAKEAIRMGRFN
jgi:tetratricopeptide (TPR) repeat protein